MKDFQNVTLKDEKSIFLGENVTIGKNVTIYENNRVEGNTTLGDGCVLLPNNYIKDCKIGDNVTVHQSVLEDSEVGDGVQIGPFARLRPRSVIKKGAKIGNFVEIKNATVGENTKVSHLAYVGDAVLGDGCNVGCGAIFVNYNGRTKSRTVVGDNCFIGSNCNVVAPVTIADNCYICAGTTVTDDIPQDGFVIGRSRQEIKPDRAHNYLKEKK
ncbi:MAG: hypothetical protein IJ317_02705 [Clostridia bacterium]|nr:hypothetical protein [Clostridia bacterium]